VIQDPPFAKTEAKYGAPGWKDDFWK